MKNEIMHATRSYTIARGAPALLQQWLAGAPREGQSVFTDGEEGSHVQTVSENTAWGYPHALREARAGAGRFSR